MDKTKKTIINIIAKRLGLSIEEVEDLIVDLAEEIEEKELNLARPKIAKKKV